MTKSQLPAITLACPDGHLFTTRASGKVTVRCKTCGKVKRVPADRPRTVREAASYAAPAGDHQDQDQDQGAGAELAARWRLETAWSGSVKTWGPPRPQDECPECDGPLSWEPRRTLAYCPECNVIDLPPAVSAHYAREQAQRAIVAVRRNGAVVDHAAERKARVQLGARKDLEVEWVEDWIDTLGDPKSYDRVQWQREARDFTAILRRWIPEIKNSETEAELAEIKQAIITEVIQSQPGKELRAEYEAVISRADQAEQRRQYAEEQADREAEAEAERVRQQMAIEANRSSVRQVATPRAITSGPKPTGDPYASTLNSVALLIAKAQQQKEKAIKQRGKCDFRHIMGPTAADRLYYVPQRNWTGADTGYAHATAPQFRACSKHFTALEAEMTRQGYTDQVWRDLNAT